MQQTGWEVWGREMKQGKRLKECMSALSCLYFLLVAETQRESSLSGLLWKTDDVGFWKPVPIHPKCCKLASLWILFLAGSNIIWTNIQTLGHWGGFSTPGPDNLLCGKVGFSHFWSSEQQNKLTAWNVISQISDFSTFLLQKEVGLMSVEYVSQKETRNNELKNTTTDK